MKKMELLSFERVFYKVLFVVSGLDVRLRVPVNTIVKEGKEKRESEMRTERQRDPERYRLYSLLSLPSAIHIIFNKFGEDLKKAEHFALVLANRNISKCAGMILGHTDRIAYYVQKDKVREKRGARARAREKREKLSEGDHITYPIWLFFPIFRTANSSSSTTRKTRRICSW